MNHQETIKRTYLYDCLCGPFNNIVYTGLMTLALLIAIRQYDAPAWVKAFIQAADSIGRLLTPITLLIGLKFAIPTAQLAAKYMILVACMFVIAALSPSLIIYAPAVIILYILYAQPPQLMLHIYAENYPPEERGSRVSTKYAISLAAGVTCSYFLGNYLDIELQFFRYEFIFLALVSLISVYFLKKIPSVPLTKESSDGLWNNLSLIWKDPLFGVMILAYTLLGLGNSMIIPIRIEYMANPQFNINASNLNITLINIIIQGASMIISTKIWGIFFDKFHFITTRLLINSCFILAYLTFFMSDNLVLMGLSMAINGFAVAGGMIVWNLWVTKITRKERAPAYMSTHIVCSGIKGIIAPYMAYYLIKYNSPMNMGIIAALFMISSCVIFFALRRHPRIL